MEADGNQLAGQGEPWYTPWAGIFPFVLLGLMALSFEIPQEWGDRERFMYLPMTLMMGGYLVILAGLLAGALAGFPRWSFPYMIYAFVFALYISNASTPGLAVFNIEMWGRDLWGWRAWIPLGIVICLVVLINRHPGKLLGRLWQAVARDWPRLTFGFYGLLPFVLLISFDEMDNRYSFPALLAGELFVLIGAFLYLSLKNPKWGTLSLFAFALMAVFVTQGAINFYWETHSINFLTNERIRLDGPVPYASILASTAKGALAVMLFLLLPAVGKVFGWAQDLAEGMIKRLSSPG